MNLIKEIEHSIFSPAYYAQILERPLSFSVRYYLSFALLLALLMTTFLSFALVPQLYLLLDRYGNEIVTAFPKDAVLTIKDGILSTNKKGAITLPLPKLEQKSARAFVGAPFPVKNLAVIDPRADFGPADLAKLQALILVDKDQLFYQEEGNKVSIQSLKHTPDATITYSSLTRLFAEIRPMIKVLMPLMVVVIFFLFIFVLALNFVYLLFGALLIMLVSRWRGLKLGYRKAYQVGLHAITASVLVEYITFMFWPTVWNNSYFAFFPTIVVALIAVINLRSPHDDSPVLSKTE